MELTTQDNYEDEDLLLEFLGRQLKQGRLALILGAGISTVMNVPQWDILLQRMYQAKRLRKPVSGPLPIQAEAFRDKYFTGDDEGFKKAVHDALYKNVNHDFSNLQHLRTLAAIGAMVMTSRRGSAAQVITFNYDNLLELYLQYHGYLVRSVTEGVALAGVADVTIYHPHGYLPFEEPIKWSKKIVLDQESYSEMLGDPSLPWYQLVHTILRSHICLFIGLSGSDPNLDQFLVRVGKIHPSIEDGNLYWGITFTTSSDALPRSWGKRKVFLKKLKAYDPDLPNFLFKICQHAATATR